MKGLITKTLEKINDKNIKYFLLLLVTLSVILIIYNLFNLTAIGLFFLMNILALTLGIFTYLKTKPIRNKDDPNFYSHKILYITIIIYSVLLAFSTIISYFSITYRDLAYFILVSLAFSIIGFQILYLNYEKKFVKIILIEIITIIIFNKISIYFINKELPFWDTFFHSTVIYSIFNTNQLPPSETNWGAFGLFHTFNTMILKILFNETNINYIYIDILIVVPFIIFSYYIIYKIFNNFKYGLFSSLLASIIIPDQHFTPHPFSFMLYLVVIYLLFNVLFNLKISRKTFLILILISFSSFLYHPSSGLFLSIIFLSINLILFSFKNLNKIFPYLYLIITISYLLYVTGPFFEFVIKRFTLPTPNPGYYEYLAGGRNFNEFVDYYVFSHIYYPVIIYFSALAIPYFILNKNFKSYYLPIIAMITFLFPFLILVSYRTSEQVIGTWLITYSAALIGGASINVLSNSSKKKIISVFLIFLTLAFFTFILNTDDNPYFDKYKNPFARASFATDSMIKAREIFELMPKDKNVTGEHTIMSWVIHKYYFLINEQWIGVERLYNTLNNTSWKGVWSFSKFGIERNGFYDKNKVMETIKEFTNKENFNIILNSDNVIIFYNS